MHAEGIVQQQPQQELQKLIINQVDNAVALLRVIGVLQKCDFRH
ncbi:MAG: hypothetical protein WA919_01040 [Coleofasciculaceae cyanobacterium]